MKRTTTISVLVLVPLAWAALFLAFMHARGPHWLSANQDPDYLFSLTSLNMAQFRHSGFNEYPAVTVKLLGAAVMHAIHLFRPGQTLQCDVLAHPELFLNSATVATMCIFLALLWVTGIIVWAATRSLVLGVLAQMTPAGSVYFFSYHLSRLSTEAVLYVASGLLALMCAVALVRPIARMPQRYAFLFALVVGFGVASKFNFAPLAFLPLIALPGARARLVYLAALPASIALWLAPVLYDWRTMAVLLKRNVETTGAYHAKTVAWLGTTYFEDLHTFIVCEQPYFLVLALALCVTAWGLAMRLVRRPPHAGSGLTMLAGLSLSQAALVLLMARAHNAHYLAPAFGLAGITLVYALMQVSEWMPRRAAVVRVAVVLVLLPLSACLGRVNMKRAEHLYSGFKKMSTEHLQLDRVLRTTYARHAKVFYTWHLGASSVEHALDFGNRYALGNHSAALQRLYPGTYFMCWPNGQTTFRDWVAPLSFEELWWRNTNVVLVGMPFDGHPRFRRPNLPLVEAMRVSDHCIYVVGNYAPTAIPGLESEGTTTSGPPCLTLVYDLQRGLPSPQECDRLRVSRERHGTVDVLRFASNSAPLAVEVSGLPTGSHARTVLAVVNMTAHVRDSAPVLYGECRPLALCAIALNPSRQFMFWDFGPSLSWPERVQRGRWYAVAISRDSHGSCSLYLDGELLQERLLPQQTAPSRLLIGARGFVGCIADVRVWDNALPPSDIARISDDILRVVKGD